MKALAVAVPAPKSMLERKPFPAISAIPNNNVEELENANPPSDSVFDNGIIESVLAYEPNLLQTDRSGRSAFDWAKLTGNTQALHWLEKRQHDKSIRHQSRADRQERVAQCTEILQRHEQYIERIKRLIAPQFFDEGELVEFLRATTISSAAFTKAYDDLQAMDDAPKSLPFRSKYFVNIETREGWTPLAKCAAFGYVAGVQELLAMGANLHYETRLQHTAMTWASYCGHEAVVLHLLRAGVSLDQKTRDGKTALLHAITNSQAKIVRHLLSATRDQCFPEKPNDTFSSEVEPGQKQKELKPVGVEWHNTFLKDMRRKDQAGKDALALARDAVKLAGLDERDDGAANGELPPAAQVLRQVRAAIQEAEEHKVYVDTHAERTVLTRCHNAGCAFMAPKDVLPTHEQHHCTKRTVKCDNCEASLVFEDRRLHDAQECPMRRVACTNMQYGCEERMLFRDRQHHLTHHCRKRPMQCRLLCGATLHFDDLDEHESAQCPLRIVSCERGCVARFAANREKSHRIHECPKRLVPCAGKNAVEGGCGEMVTAEEMDFHLARLCELRELPCKWSSHGCEDKIGGVASARYTHETKECPFRLIDCRNGCELSGQLLACFAEEHYSWQCMLEKKPCPNDCRQNVEEEGFQLPEHLLKVHCLQDAGDCPSRMAHCPLDLCGKRIRLLDPDQGRCGTLMSADSRAAQLEKRPTSVKAMQQRVQKYQDFLAQVEGLTKQQHEVTPNATANERWQAFQRPRTAAFLVTWLRELLGRLKLEYEALEAQKDASACLCRILTFDASKRQHLVEFPDGRSVWMSLAFREFDVLLPDQGDSVSQYFRCGLVEARTAKVHTEEECCHRLVPCPLSCGQRFPAHTVEVHLSKGCNMRNGMCRLGCGQVLTAIQLTKHEAEDCKLRSVFCGHCHLSFPAQKMAKHLDQACQHRPRGCRLGCTAKIAWVDTADHESNHCPKRLIPCRICNADIWFCEREKHEHNECPLRGYGECDSGCGQTLCHNEVAHHLLYSCSKRIVDCDECKQRMQFASLTEHRSLLCPQRVVSCRKGCGLSLKEADADLHEDQECPKRLLFCTNQCGLHVPSCEMEEHLKAKCSMRVIECPTGCRDWIFAYLYDDHWKRCRQRIVPCGVGGKLCARPIRLWHQGRKLVQCAVHGESALLWAVKCQDVDLVTYLLQSVEGSNAVNEEFTNGFSPLVLAASLGNVDLVQLLLRFGADVNLETSRGRTPLAEACIALDPVIVKLLIDNRANVSHTNRQGRNLLEMVHAFADSNATMVATSDAKAQSDSKWQEIIQILEEQAQLERDQRDLFIAIACSDYDHLIQCFKYSAKPPSQTSAAVNPVEALEELVNAKQKQAQETRAELDEAVHVFNESIAETEAKRVKAVQLSSQVDDGCRRLQSVEKAEEASDVDSNALEAEMLAMIRQITAQDVAQLLNAHVPSEQALVVVKALSLLCGVVPRGRRNATEYTDVEWWKTAQALLMDRSLLRRLRGYRQQEISPDVMSKVRRECLKTPAFAACAAAFKESRDRAVSERNDSVSEAAEHSPSSQLPPAETLRGNIVGILATWVHGVEIEYKARAERQVLVERKQQLTVALTVAREKKQHATFEAQVEARSLPARQEEVEVVRHQCDTAEKELEVAKKRLSTYKLLNYAALSGHTPLTFACAVGNDAIVHMLLSHGASSGHHFEEQVLCATFIQVLVRDFQCRKKFEHERRLQEASGGGIKPRSDAAIEALVRNVAHAFIVGHYKRKLAHFRQTHRVALHEAVLNGHPEIAAILLSKDARLWHKTYVLPERVYPGALLENIAPVSKDVHDLVKHRGKWKLQPLVKKFQEDESHSVQVCGPMTLAETLKCALSYYDSRLFSAAKGWESPDVTLYSATARLVNDGLAKREAERQQWQKELALRRSVLRKTVELKDKHATLEKAIISRDFVAVSRSLDDGAFADYETSQGALTALMAACIEEVYVRNEDNKDVLAVEFLSCRTMNRPLVNFENSRGATALRTAAFYGTLKCAQTLTEHGANLNLASRFDGRTALMVAADNGKAAFVRFLLAFPEVDVFLRDARGQTALDYARNRRFVKLSGLLEAAMGGCQGSAVSTLSGLYGVCKWGCGLMTAFEAHVVHKTQVVKDMNPLEEHERHHCPKRYVRCPYNCGLDKLWAEELRDHTEHTCVLRLVRCTNQKCSVRVAFKDRVSHLQDECEYRVVLCQCAESMISQRYAAHTKTQCPMRLVSCPLQCIPTNTDENDGVFQLRWQDVKAHVTSDCPHRNVRCRNGCAINDLMLKHRSHHETRVCPLRRVSCKWGCQETVFASTLGLHERDECELRQQGCPNRCGGDNVPVLQMDEHLSTTCSRRLVACSLGCGRLVPLYTMEAHLAQECRKRAVTCPQCQLSLLEENRETHHSTQCPNRLASCGLCGQTKLSYFRMTHHRREECKMRQVACKYQCFIKVLLAHEREHHELWECTLRPIYCPLGCGEVVVCNTLKRHQRVCQMRFVACGNGCGEELREKDRVEHEQYYCSLNKTTGNVSR
jgi:ankyrin repeat protein